MKKGNFELLFKGNMANRMCHFIKERGKYHNIITKYGNDLGRNIYAVFTDYGKSQNFYCVQGCFVKPIEGYVS